jgi:lysophospholipase L1-like esterase
MIKNIVFGILIFSFLAITSCSSGPKLKELNKDSVILAFGDSLTYGTGAEKENSYPSVLEKLISRKVINEGIPGEVSITGLKRLPEVMDKHQPSLMILCHGGNDILRKKDLNAAKNNIIKMIKLARERNIEVVLIGVPKFGLILSPAEIYNEIAEELKIPYEKDILSDVLQNPKMHSDPIHPNAAGYHKIAESIAVLLEKSGALKRP